MPIANNTVNAVAMTVLPDAPVDVVTGLKVPTVDLFTDGGTSRIQHNGVVVSATNISPQKGGGLSRLGKQINKSYEGFRVAASLTDALGYAAWAYNSFYGTSSPPAEKIVYPSSAPLPTADSFVKGKVLLIASPKPVNIIAINESYGSRSILASVNDTYATGHLPGDIRRCYLADTVVESISNPVTQPDRSYKAAAATVHGTLTKSLTASANQLVAYSGFSAANYLREPYSADLDFGTGEWSVGAWVNVPVTLPVGNFPAVGGELFSFVTPAITNNSGCSGSYNTSTHVMSNLSIGTSASYPRFTFSMPLMLAGQSYVVTGQLSGDIGSVSQVRLSYGGGQALSYDPVTGVFSGTVPAVSPVIEVHLNGTVLCAVTLTSCSIKLASPAMVLDRKYTSGPSMAMGITSGGLLTATAYDGTTTSTVTTTAAYNTATWLKAVANYRAGRLAIEVNGVEVAVTNGSPLLTLNNSNAVLTIGNSYALAAPFPGSIALLKLGATVPSPEQSLWMYEQEKMMFRDGAQITLPSSGSVVDLTYDEAQDKWVALQATHESSWTGLVRTGVTTPSAGSFSKAEAKSGVKLLARTTTTPGVDITIPALGLKEELVRRAEAAAAQSRQLQVFDFDTVGFTAAMTSGSPTVTASSIVGTPYIGMGITGPGVPANTTIIGINGTTYTLSANCTATASNAVAQSTFTLTPGWTTTEVIAASASKREGSTKDWVRLYDGFRETVRFAVSPGSAAWVQITARKDT